MFCLWETFCICSSQRWPIKTWQVYAWPLFLYKFNLEGVMLREIQQLYRAKSVLRSDVYEAFSSSRESDTKSDEGLKVLPEDDKFRNESEKLMNVNFK